MKSVAICGFADTTRDFVKRSAAAEIWSMNWVYNYDFLPRIDRLFEMHPIWVQAASKKPEYEKPRKHWQWLQEQHPYPIYMLEHRSEVPACVPYPLEEVASALYKGHLLKGNEETHIFGSSIDYMVALAIYEGFQRIELYGVEMGSMTEYRYQRESLMFYAGIAAGRGIDMYIPENSILFGKRLYMYEGGQMIYRQDLERLYEKAQQKRTDAMARLQFMEGKASNWIVNRLLNRNIGAQLQTARDDVLMAQAMEDTLGYLIREIDLEEVSWEVRNPLKKIEVKV